MGTVLFDSFCSLLFGAENPVKDFLSGSCQSFHLADGQTFILNVLTQLFGEQCQKPEYPFCSGVSDLFESWTVSLEHYMALQDIQ